MNNKELEIVTKAMELFGIYGIKSVSMDDIATHMAISKKTIYKYVNDKADLVQKVVAFNIESNRSKLKQLLSPNMNAIEEMIIFIKFLTEMHQFHSPTMFFDIKKYYPEVYKYLSNTKKLALKEFYNDNFKKGIDEGLYRKNMNTSVISRIIIFLTDKITDNDQFTIEELCSPSFIYELYLYHLHGITTIEGLKKLNEFETKFKY